MTSALVPGTGLPFRVGTHPFCGRMFFPFNKLPQHFVYLMIILLIYNNSDYNNSNDNNNDDDNNNKNNNNNKYIYILILYFDLFWICVQTWGDGPQDGRTDSQRARQADRQSIFYLSVHLYMVQLTIEHWLIICLRLFAAFPRKFMLKTKFENFEKGETFHAIGHDVLGADLAVPQTSW
jgi:hypothetical protein